MVREKDRFWGYVEDLNGRFLCKFCDKSFSGGITRIKSHLSGVRGRDIEICLKVPRDVQIAALQAISTLGKKVGGLRSFNTDRETEIISTSSPNKKAKSSRQPTVPRESQKDKNIVDKLLAKFILTNNFPLDVSKTPFLVDLLRSISEIGHTYQLPSYSGLNSELILDVHKEIQEYTRNVKKFFTTTGCTLIMSKVILDDSEDRMVNCLTDFTGDDFFLKAMEMILRKYPWIYLSRCVNGELGILLILIYLGVPWIHKTTQLAKLIFKYLYEHDINLLPRKEHTRNREYNRGGLTKIAIEVFMLNSILDLKKELQALQLPIASASFEGEGTSSENEVAEVVHIAIHSTEFWSRGKKVVQVLQPLFQVLELVDDNGSSSGYLYEAMKRVEEAFKQHLDDNDKISGVFKGWRSRVLQPIHSIAALLNPAYMCSQKFSEDSEIQKGLEILLSLVPIAEQEALLKQVQLYREKVSDLFTATAMNMLNTFNPRKWWECCGDPYPILQKYAIQILSQTCTTSLLDHCNFTQNVSVDGISRDIIIMEKFSALKLQKLELIDLDKISGIPEYAPEFILEFLEELDWSDNIDYRDLLVDDQVPTPSQSNNPDVLFDIRNQTDWMFTLEEMNNRDDCSDIINHYLNLP
ncbi:HAT transposon superfamily [Melia azedarach]|uniref:HAT transposon superfamily n=1 Tax=Melia azedarach TaxID=155640 RepID=A0ACC1YUQ3_MELAZ|nr:HAT transposon superfamily [Melia azedarach]